MTYDLCTALQAVSSLGQGTEGGRGQAYGFDKESWDGKLMCSEHTVCIQTQRKESSQQYAHLLCAMTHRWQVVHRFQLKDDHVDLFCQCLRFFNKSTLWPHRGLSFKTNSPKLFGKQSAGLLVPYVNALKRAASSGQVKGQTQLTDLFPA